MKRTGRLLLVCTAFVLLLLIYFQVQGQAKFGLKIFGTPAIELEWEHHPPPKKAERQIGKVNQTTQQIFPTLNDETELLLTFIGMSRFVEHNLRIYYERKTVKHKDAPIKSKDYIKIIKDMRGKYISEIGYQLFKNTATISNGLVHSDLQQVKRGTENCYKVKELKDELKHKKISMIMVAATTITKDGLIVDAKTGKATTQKGVPVPSKVYDFNKDLDKMDMFNSFYVTAFFVFTFDVLRLAFEQSVRLREFET